MRLAQKPLSLASAQPLDSYWIELATGNSPKTDVSGRLIVKQKI
jgi:hypothetical protein